MAKAELVQSAESVRIAIPPEFPVVWDSSDDEQLSWLHDRMHNPDPVLPLESAFWGRVYEAFNRATETYEMSVRLKTRCFNTYFYMAIKTVVPPEEVEAQNKRAAEQMDAAMARLADAWTAEWLPEIRVAPGLVGRLRSRRRDDAGPAARTWRTPGSGLAVVGAALPDRPSQCTWR